MLEWKANFCLFGAIAFMKEEKNEEAKKFAAEVVGIEPMPVESMGELGHKE